MPGGRTALGLAAAIPALLLGAAMITMGRTAGPDSATPLILSGGLVILGVAVAVAGIHRARRIPTYLGSLAVAAGSIPILATGLGAVLLLSALLLAVSGSPSLAPRTLRVAARAVTAASLALLLVLAWRDQAAGRAPNALDALLWGALLLLVAYAWWPQRAPDSPTDARGKTPSPRQPPNLR